jgi:hypothetical protein
MLKLYGKIGADRNAQAIAGSKIIGDADYSGL